MVDQRWSLRKRIAVVIGVLVGLPAAVLLLAVALFFAYIFVWFSSGALFSGDGKYRRGVEGAAFQVQFPPIDLSRPGRYSFSFTRLAPPMGYSVGLRLYDRPDEPSALPSAVVAITLSNERGELVFAQKRRLSDWNWRRNMAVINGRSVEVPIGGGSVRIQNLDIGPDGGWGTHFTPRWRGRYTLTLEVLQPDPAAARLVVRPVIEGYTAGP